MKPDEIDAAMSHTIYHFSVSDYWAIGLFLVVWFTYEVVENRGYVSTGSLSRLMNKRRYDWMMVMAEREMRMVDTSIISGLLQGTAFFASTSILAIGGCFALLGATDSVLAVLEDLPVPIQHSRVEWEIKILGLAALFVYTFFKFGWAFRLFNYSAILVGSVPTPDISTREERREKAIEAAEMNSIAGMHFTSGLRGMFFALAYLGWFFGAIGLVISTVWVLAVLLRRQYFSRSRALLLDK